MQPETRLIEFVGYIIRGALMSQEAENVIALPDDQDALGQVGQNGGCCGVFKGNLTLRWVWDFVRFDNIAQIARAGAAGDAAVLG